MDRKSKPTRGNTLIMLAIGVAGMAVLACAHQPDAPSPTTPVMGFFMGFVHGFLILFSFFASLVSDIRIYAYPNAGGWYDLGFVLGAMTFLGGGGAGSRKGKKRKARC